MSSDLDVLVVGAGLSGIAFARFYLEIHPKASLTILEADSCVGGVWSATRSYHDFYTQSPCRMLGFSDVEFKVPDKAPIYFEMVEAKYITDYLERYINGHVYNGKSLRERVIFNHRVVSITKDNGIWITQSQGPKGSPRELRSPKLVVAAGRTSVPNMPSLLGRDAFEGQVAHHKDFGRLSKSILTDKRYKTITVIGGGKSAADMAYASAKAGKIVHWIIRASGEGPAMFFPSDCRHPRYLNAVEQSATRYKAFYSPSSFVQYSMLHGLFHMSKYGKNRALQRITRNDNFCRSIGNFKTRDNALPGFENMECTTSGFWCTGPVGAIQHGDFYDVFAEKIHIHRDDITGMNKNGVRLSSGKLIESDVVLCGTGWNSQYPFFSAEEVRRLGLAHPKDDDSTKEDELWDSLLRKADALVTKRFPILAEPPPHRLDKKAGWTTTRLYHSIVPLEDSSVAFIGHANASNGFKAAEAEAIWTTALWDGHVSIPPLEQAREDVAYMNAFSRRRYPSQGATGDNFFFELVSYTDKLLSEVGLTSHFKKDKRDNWLEPCLNRDFKHMPDEYREKYGIEYNYHDRENIKGQSDWFYYFGGLLLIASAAYASLLY